MENYQSMKDQIKKDNKYLEEFKDLFNSFTNFIKHFMFDKDKECEDYWKFSKGLYKHRIFSDKTIDDIKEDYNWSKKDNKHKDHDDFDLEI